MRDVIVSLFASLDSFATDSGEKMDWVQAKMGQDSGLQEASLAQVMAAGTLLYGRKTYLTMAAAWPKAKDEAGFADQMNGLPKVVFSRTLQVAEWNNSTINQGDPAAEVAKLKQQPGGDLLVYGSLTLVRSLMSQGLVDRFRLWVHPVILGDDGGRRIAEGYRRRDLSVAATRTFESGVMLVDYTRPDA
ncbi:MAG TPA: dihydrofolate reductase family protein [Actinomycetes bacterium]|jgi:dihydrofolate reductase|nr:dihydrofolate reductase family protein [Actinomycetes bacterium]